MERVILVIELRLRIRLVMIVFQVYIQRIILVIELRAKELVSLRRELTKVKIIRS